MSYARSSERLSLRRREQQLLKVLWKEKNINTHTHNEGRNIDVKMHENVMKAITWSEMGVFEQANAGEHWDLAKTLVVSAFRVLVFDVFLDKGVAGYNAMPDPACVFVMFWADNTMQIALFLRLGCKNLPNTSVFEAGSKKHGTIKVWSTEFVFFRLFSCF